jgi:hypothetical protein
LLHPVTGFFKFNQSYQIFLQPILIQMMSVLSNIYSAEPLPADQCSAGSFSEHGDASNPFEEIKQHTLEKRLAETQYRRELEAAVDKAFLEHDSLVTTRLNQLGQALTCSMDNSWLTPGLRALSQCSIAWHWLHPKAKYVVKQNRAGKEWQLSLSGHLGANYHHMFMLKVRILLDKQMRPSGLAAFRGYDNKVFTSSFNGTEFSKVLLCHFSRAACGNNFGSDAAHLHFLLETGQICAADYSRAKLVLLSDTPAPRTYTPRRTPAHVLIRRENNLRLLFCIFCIVSTLCIILVAYRSASAPASVDRPSISLGH